MRHYFKFFAKNEDGAVTVDWVVLSAAIIGIAVGAISSIQDANESLASATSTAISDMPVNGSGE